MEIYPIYDFFKHNSNGKVYWKFKEESIYERKIYVFAQIHAAEHDLCYRKEEKASVLNIFSRTKRLLLRHMNIKRKVIKMPTNRLQS